MVVRDGDEVHATALVERIGAGGWGSYLDQIRSALSGLLAAEVELLAVEGLRPPSPHVRQTNPSAVIDTARVLGWVESISTVEVVEVAPGGHGSSPLGAYPAHLVGRHEEAGRGRRRHLRSAWDIAGAGVTLSRWGR